MPSRLEIAPAVSIASTAASVAVSRTPSGVLNYHNAGKVQASSEPQDMRLQRMLGHLTTLTPKQAKALSALLQEPTLARAAAVAGCGERSLRRWLSETPFRDAVYRARHQASESVDFPNGCAVTPDGRETVRCHGT